MRHLILLLSFVKILSAQSSMPSSLGDWKAMKKLENGISITTTNGTCRVLVYSPSILRISINRSGEFGDFSYAVVANPSTDKFSLKETASELLLITDSLQLAISKKPVRLKLMTPTGKVINADEENFGASWVGEEITTYKKLFPGERFIGLGEKTGPLDRSGEGYTNWNTDYFGYPETGDPIYATIPFYIGLHGTVAYGVFLDNSYRTDFNFGASNDRFSSFMVNGGDMDYYLIHRSTVAGILESYTHLTGRMELPPLWSLGFQQCRYSYFPESDFMTVAQTFRNKKIPCDVLYLDIHYMDKYKLFTWDKDRFPDPKGMLSKLEQQRFKVVTIIDPGVKDEAGYAPNEEGIKNNLFLKYQDGKEYRGQVWPGWCHFPDFTNPKTRTWWGTQFKGFVSDGIDGFWNDMNEPATWGQKFPDNVIFDFDGRKGTHREGHNIFGFQMARSTFEGQKKLMPNNRPFVLTRAGFAGLQRYTSIWTGDNLPTDAHLLLGVRLVNSLGLSGVPFAGYDISGFGADATRELFARWISVGAFCPFSRSHKGYGNKASEPWSYGEDVEEISRNYLQLRYNLMPYIYSSFYESTQTGMPVQRSLAIDYSFDARVYNRSFQNQYLFGSSIMVVPCKSTEQIVRVYLPAGKWFDLHSDKLYNGNTEENLNSPLSKLPVLVKAGGLIPMQSPVQSTSEPSSDTLYLQAYLGDNGSFLYYEDAGDGYAYQKGVYYKRTLSMNASKSEIILSQQEGSYLSKFKHIRILFHGMPGTISTVSINGTRQPLAEYNYGYLSSELSESLKLKSAVLPNSSNEVVIKW